MDNDAADKELIDGWFLIEGAFVSARYLTKTG